MPEQTGSCCRSYIKNKYLQQIRSRPSQLGWVKNLEHRPASFDGPSKASASMPAVVSKALFVHSLYLSRYFEEGIVVRLGYHNPTALTRAPILVKNIKIIEWFQGSQEQVGRKQFHCEKGRGDSVGRVLHPFPGKCLKEDTALNDLAGKRAIWWRTLTCADDGKPNW